MYRFYRIKSFKQTKEIRSGERSLGRREALSFCAGVYDPLGHIGPALLRGRLLLQRLHGAGGTWDSDIPVEERVSWGDWFQELASETRINMERTVRPKGAKGKPTLAGFSDASKDAMCCTIYVVWEKEQGGRQASLLLAKTRVVPLQGTSVPRAEMQAVVMLVRLIMVALRAAAFTCKLVTSSTDSGCSVAALRRTGSSLHPYFANRVAEIRHTLQEARKLAEQVEDVTHVPGAKNPADMGTRAGASLKDLGQGSVWQTGPAFLLQPRT